MRLNSVVLIITAIFAVLSAYGCYDSVDITWYEPGVYKGPRDPLRNKLDNSTLQNQLVERLRAVQTDR